MNILCGINLKRNPSGFRFFTFKKAKGKNSYYWDGLFRTATDAQFFGPWKNRNIEDHYYHIIFNYDGNEFIREPAELEGEKIYGYRYLIYHKGNDGKIGGKYNVENLYS